MNGYTRFMRVAIWAVLVGCASESPRAPVADEGDAAIDARTEVTAEVAVDAGADATDATETGPSALRVLFVGNSYTFTNDLPGTLAAIATTSKVPPSIEVAEVTVGGATFKSLFDAGDAQKRIDEKTWTHVVLQGQSLEPLWQPTVFKSYGSKFADAIQATAARVVWFATWARIEGDPSYAETWSGATPDGMQDGLTAGYTALATKYPSSLLVKAGEAFRLVKKERPTLALQVDDKSHPTIAGTYLAACMFYVALAAKEVPTSSVAPKDLAPADVTYLRGVPARVK